MDRRRTAPLDRDALAQYALRVLTMRAMSASELRTRLLRRAAHPPDVDSILEQLAESKLLDDTRFANSYAAARLENQGFGRMRVLRDLRRRRISSDVAESAVHQTFEGTDEAALIEQYLQRKFRGKNLAEFLAEDKNLLAAYRRLRTAGFAPGTSIRVLKRYASQADALDEDME